MSKRRYRSRRVDNGNMKWYTYLICIVLIIAGIFAGTAFYNEATATSYKNGSINIENQFSQEQFYYSNSAVVFYPNENSEAYTFEIDLNKTEGFDAEVNEYEVYLNGFVLLDTTFTGGSITSNVDMHFYNVDGEVAHEGEMTILLRFLNNKTQLKLSCPDVTSATYFEEYFTTNGIRLAVLEIVE